ncbi:MAG: Asp-tRNA(Asn)/Glu-tRNA(Gln) amidotransferase subunit GatC [Chlamydiia bacterium]|nr:Asp-tRNA(Asn)/Glu-tRNA(Gln) amidotransferase subunit GatC [Chlamydiia bacterium]
MSKLNKETLTQLSELCRIRCEGKEFEKLLENLQSILGYFDQLQEVDTEGVKVCNHVSESVHSFTREDDPKELLDREKFLKNSPSHVGGMIRVPPVIKF